MLAPTKHIAELYLPQFEQFGLSVAPQSDIYTGEVVNDKGFGRAWVMPISDTCVIMEHCITPTRDMLLAEYAPEPYACVTEVSEASVACMSSIGIEARRFTAPEDARGSEGAARAGARGANAGSAGTAGGAGSAGGGAEGAGSSMMCTFLQATTGCEMSPLKAGHLYHSRAIMFFEGYFNELERAYPHEFAGLFEAFDQGWDAASSAAMASALRGLALTRTRHAGSHLYVRSLIDRMVAEMAAEHAASRVARQAESTHASRNLAIEAATLIAQLVATGRVPSLEALARSLFVSRSKLCAVFKAEMGQGVASYVRQCRTERACQLLSQRGASVAQIAAQLGYPQQAAFAQAFKQATGLTPTEWRRVNA